MSYSRFILGHLYSTLASALLTVKSMLQSNACHLQKEISIIWSCLVHLVMFGLVIPILQYMVSMITLYSRVH